MTIYRQQPVELSGLRTYPLATRPSKVTVRDFATPLTAEQRQGMQALLQTMPDLLAADSLRQVAAAIREARSLKRAIIWGIGGHFIKTGLAPILIDLMRRGYVTAIATNGSGIIHDFEIAMTGWTSEDVDAALGSGDFGMAEETGRMINQAIIDGLADDCGVGESVGKMLVEARPVYADYSYLHEAYRNQIPVTAHITIGADIIHLHSQADGAAIGAASHRDFRLFISLVRELHDGGVYLNIGSAVTLPEIFLKAVTTVRNLGYPLAGFTTANFDFLQHYRPLTNVVRRPVANGAGKGYSVTGHHEILIPLLAAMLD